MAWKLSNLPNGREDYTPPVEQATAAPGEVRDVNPVCDACGGTRMIDLHALVGPEARQYTPRWIECTACKPDVNGE